jgi:hypothetical protein
VTRSERREKNREKGRKGEREKGKGSNAELRVAIGECPDPWCLCAFVVNSGSVLAFLASLAVHPLSDWRAALD